LRNQYFAVVVVVAVAVVDLGLNVSWFQSIYHWLTGLFTNICFSPLWGCPFNFVFKVCRQHQASIRLKPHVHM
jgi:hypothetical protein